MSLKNNGLFRLNFIGFAKVKRTVSRLVLHPFFFALYPILNLYAENLGQVSFRRCCARCWFSSG